MTRISEFEKNSIWIMYRKGYGKKKISEKLGCNEGRVYYVLNLTKHRNNRNEARKEYRLRNMPVCDWWLINNSVKKIGL